MSDVKKEKTEKNSKRSKNKGSNVIPFKQDLPTTTTKTLDPVSFREKELNKINKHCRKTFQKLEKFADRLGISGSECWYTILYFAKQRAIYSNSYGTFKINDEYTTKEITKNYVKFTDENFPELKVDSKPKILH